MAEKLQPGKIDGALSGAGLRFGIVVSRFNSFITERLLSAAVDALERAGAESKDVDVVHVPGAFELPLAAKKLAATGRYDVLIAIGCVLRGETTHYDYVCSESARVAIGANGQWDADYFLRADVRHAGAGHRPRRSEGRQQGI
jgi:6,7-dimethyl-8-ribityllumazine synthase